MDELISLILHGIKLAKEVEPMLQSLATHQEMASRIDEICRVFFAVRERLNSVQDPNLFPQMVYRELQQQLNPSSLLQQEYYAKAMMDLFQPQLMAEAMRPITSPPADTAMESGGPAAATASSSSQRLRRRKEDPRRSVTVPAPRMGNVDIPPEDGFTWRKYGQKEILNSKFPRAYYRCTHQKLYQCPAKKQVQRLDDDPFTFEVTYRGDHTCHMSATAPSSAPPPGLPPPPQLDAMAQPPWLEFSLGGGGAGAGPSSSSRYGKETDQYLVADLANVMFNSGSSSSNSMELIFTTTTSMEDKWDTEDDKKN